MAVLQIAILLTCALCAARAQSGADEAYERTLPEYAECGPNTLPCEKGLRCVGTAGDRFCLPPVGLGEECGSHPHDYCGGVQTCRRGRCMLVAGLGVRCRQRFVTCNPKLRCLGGKKPVCKRVVGSGKRCNPPNVVCKGPLKCRSGTCRPPIVIVGPGGNCASANRRCKRRFSCVGSFGVKRCKQVLGLGERCANRRTTVCRQNLRCCTANELCVRYVRPGGSCAGRFHRCTAGSRCVGNDGDGDDDNEGSPVEGANKLCKRVLGLGRNCANSRLTVCRGQLRCSEKSKRCVRDVRPGGKCAGRFRRCESGSSCVGSRANKRCKRVLKLGESCANKRLTLCRRFHTCTKNSQRCVLNIPPGGKCAGRFRRCTEGFTCVGKGRNQRCKRVLKLGQSCAKNRVTTCRRIHRCSAKSQRCMIDIRPAGNCAGRFRRCRAGFSCIDDRCAKRVSAGRDCSKSYLICRGPLKCIKDRCVRPVRYA